MTRYRLTRTPEGGIDMRHANEYESLDRAALDSALLALKTCPRCRADLQPVALFDNVWGCPGKVAGCRLHPFETWHLPEEGA